MMSWIERAADRSDAPQRSRARRIKQAKEIVDAAVRLMRTSGSGFTIQQLADEAGIALQTFYRYFPSKDELFLAVLEEVIAGSCAEMEEAGRRVADPVERLKLFITWPLQNLQEGAYVQGRAIMHEHLRLHQRFPNEVEKATSLFTDLVARSLREAQEKGLLSPTDPERDAWVINELVRTTYHHFAFVEFGYDAQPVFHHLWTFCLRALGGVPDSTQALGTKKLARPKAAGGQAAAPAAKKPARRRTPVR